MNKKIKLLSTRQVSEYLSLSVRTVQRLAEQGKIKAVKIGGQWKCSEADIKRYLSSGTDFSKEPARKPNNFTQPFQEGTGFIERRACPRVNCYLPCYIKVIIPQKKEIFIQSRILNIGKGGVFLENYNNEDTFLCIKNDDPVNLTFVLNKERLVDMEGRVVRTQKEGIAVKFRNISDNAKEAIDDYVG